MKRLLRFIIPFSGLVLAIVLVKTISVVAYTANIPATVNVSLNSRANAALSPTTPEGAILVTTLEDELNGDGDCSLREAITAANSNSVVDACPAGDADITDTITFAVQGTITITSQLSVTAGGPLVIDGGEVISISGGGTTKVWLVDTGANLSMLNLTTENAYFNGECCGAGIYNKGNLLIINNHIINNIRDGSCDPYCYGSGGGIFNNGTLLLTKSTLSGNSAFNYGGGIANNGTLTISNSTLSGNKSNACGAIFNGVTLTMTTSTISGNSASTMGGGICAEGTVIVSNSTLSGNSASHIGGAIAHTNTWGMVKVINSTFSENSASDGGAIFIYSDGLTVTNTIIANSHLGGDCSGTIIDGGHNLDSDGTCSLDPANGSLPNIDPMLGPLQNNGGLTWTYALLSGSPAIDAGNDALCPSTDQRGVARPFDGDGDGISVCDIGSFEFGGHLYPLFLPLVIKFPYASLVPAPSP